MLFLTAWLSLPRHIMVVCMTFCAWWSRLRWCTGSVLWASVPEKFIQTHFIFTGTNRAVWRVFSSTGGTTSASGQVLHEIKGTDPPLLTVKTAEDGFNRKYIRYYVFYTIFILFFS